MASQEPASIPSEDVGQEVPAKEKPLTLTSRNTYCYGLLLLLGNLVWFVAAFSESWVTREDGVDKVRFTLAEVQRGPDNLVGMSWNCFTKTYCDIDNQSDLCTSWMGIQNGSILYLGASGFATLFTLLLIERLVFLYAGKDAGWKWITFTLLVMVPVAQLLAVAGFFGLSEAEFNGSCGNTVDDMGSKAKFCADRGPILAIIGLLWSFITSAILFVFYIKRDPKVDDGLHLRLGRCLYLNTFYWFAILAAAVVCVAIMMIVSIILDDWVERNDLPKFTGSLLACKDCDPDVKFLAFDCYAAKFCYIDGYGYCSMFRDLKNGGYAYLYLVVAALVCMIFWFDALMHVMARREFGLPFFNYLSPFLAFVFMLLAILVWFNVTNASFSNLCSLKNDQIFEKPSLCPTSGPALAAASLAVLATLVPLHFLLYALRDYIKPPQKSSST